MKLRRCLIVMLLAVWPFGLLCAAPLPVPVPTYEEHKAFLYGEWKPNRPSAILFIDPFCPYCKRAIPKLTKVQHYNLFVFWAPIFGDRSEKAIAPFFECAEPTSKPILDGVVLNPRAAPKVCHPNEDADLRQRNDAMVAAYGINAVPSYYLQGQRTSLIALQETPTLALPSRVLGVVLPWNRYSLAELLDTSDTHNAAILFPPNTPWPTIQQSLTQFKPQYVFFADQWVQQCHELRIRACQQKSVQQLPGFYQEVITLLGVEPKSQYPLVITYNGNLENR